MHVTPLDEKEAFVRIARAITPVRDQLIVIGGWAHQLHQYVDLAQPLGFQPLRTSDVDLATPSSNTMGAFRLDKALEAQGFDPEYRGSEHPPATRYVLRDHPSFYAEFVTNLRGSGLRRDGARDATIEVGGVVAAKLRYVDLLSLQPWKVELTESHGFPVGDEELYVFVANASSFLAQKLLIMDKRETVDRIKDLVYIYDTLQLFAESLPQLAGLWETVVPQIAKATRVEAERRSASIAGAVNEELRGAAKLIGSLQRPHSPDAAELAQALRSGLSVVFRRAQA